MANKNTEASQHQAKINQLNTQESSLTHISPKKGAATLVSNSLTSNKKEYQRMGDGNESLGEKQGSQLLLMKESASIEQHQNSQFGGAGVQSTEMFSVKNTIYRGQEGMS